ncbi:hypothetical protein HZY91_05915 [Facklamia sp. DSM 111018]|uniref:V-type ATP synthase subunit G n=1 Tax=Facklamia lactis TaxID=2749967 RepID=A0ABS0LQJ5_9LACT|nr:hypothetical protein [Facklamia lactis]MBG9980614.1 hypothetical protein [Facklamia lactis]MBG9986428.1 hypothetical protein [Facklamia lactis]
MANLVDQINSLEQLSASKEAEYQERLVQMNKKFEDTKQGLQQTADDELAQFRAKVQESIQSKFSVTEAKLRQENQAEIEEIEKDLTDRREELAQKIAKKVVEQIWQ